MRAFSALFLFAVVNGQRGGGGYSRRAYKRDIVYIEDDMKQQLTKEVLAIDLTTYNYVEETEGSKKHLGFIIEDIGENSAAVDASGNAVDLYGYASMAVAAIQNQEEEISALKEEVKELKAMILAGTGKESVV